MDISIHALLAESDHAPSHSLYLRNNFYPRSPCGERPKRFCNALKHLHFYPRSPCGERPEKSIQCYPDLQISIHALLAESDEQSSSYNAYLEDFYPRSPCGERPRKGQSASIQASYFYPRSPCGERLGPLIFSVQPRNFYPRSPCGERRITRYFFDAMQVISIHALLAESDKVSVIVSSGSLYFYPRSPCGERLYQC